MIREVTDGVFTADHAVAEGKNGIVFGDHSVLAIDCGTHPAEGREMAEFIRSRGCQPNRLLYSHGHYDHVGGCEAFRGAEVYAHAMTPAVMDREAPGLAKRWETTPADVRRRLLRPNVLFRDELWLDLGGRTVHVFPAPGHSADGTCAYFVEDRLLFAADTVATGIVAAIGDGDSRVLEQSLRNLLELDIEVLVPGHGPVLRGAEVVRDWISWEADYLARVRQRVNSLVGDKIPAETIPDAVRFAEFVGDRLPADRHKMPLRHRATVAKIVEEETASPEGAPHG